MPKYLSGRTKRRSQDKLSEDRYRYLGLDQAEPNLADPDTSPPVPAGAQFQLVAVPGFPGKRYWVPIGGGLIAGAISVFDEGTIVGSANSITQLNFVGAAVTANVSVQSPSGHPGIAATISINPVSISDDPPTGARNGELWWESDTGDLFVYYQDGNSAQWVIANAGASGGIKGDKGADGTPGLTGPQGDKGEQATINNNADNRVITGSDTTHVLNAEPNLTFNGTTLAVTGSQTISNTLTVTNNSNLNSDVYIGGELNLTLGSDSDRYIDAALGTNTLTIRGTSGGDANHQNMALFTRNGSVSLNFSGNKKFETTTNGVKITGGLQDKDGQTGNSGQLLASTGSQLNWINSPTSTTVNNNADNRVCLLYTSPSPRD